MNVYSLYRQLDDNLPVQLDKKIGDGSDGEVWSIIDQPDRVVKLSIIYDHPFRRTTQYIQIQKVLDMVMATRPHAYVHIHEHGFLGTYFRQAPHHKGQQKFVIYYYIMEKLYNITQDEDKVFHSILSHEDRGIKKDLSICKIENLLQGLGQGLDFDEKKIMFFIRNITELPLIHHDLAPRNILKNNEGNYKLVDLDSCILLP